MSGSTRPAGGSKPTGTSVPRATCRLSWLAKAKPSSSSLRGDAPVIRDILKQTAIAALAADQDLGYSQTIQGALLVTAGENLMAVQGDLTGLRADLGYAETRLEESKTRLSAERTSFEMSRNELLGVDLYETATRLEAVQFQLESLYTATSRLSGLSLVRYL